MRSIQCSPLVRRAALRAVFVGAALIIGSINAKPHVSVYYYPWYSGANWNPSNFLRGKNRMDIPPLIGTYDNVVNKVPVKQHIEWSTNFGIDNWIASWWGPDSYQSNAILKNVMPNLAGTKVTFCLFYETSGFYENRWTFGPTEVQMFYDHVKYMNDNFFSHPNYWKIGGRPVVVVYLSRLMMGDYATALTRVRKDFNVFLIGDDFHFGPAEPDRHKNWDAITIYNSHGIKTYDGYPQATGFVEGARQNLRNHKKAIAATPTLLMSNVIPGYNDRAVRLEANNYPIPRRMAADSGEGSTFNQMLAMGLQEGDSAVGTAICSWNEWWEDSEIEPTVIAPPTNKDGTTDFSYSKGYMYEGYGPKLLSMILAKTGRNADVAPGLTLLDPKPNAGWTSGTQKTITWNYTGTIYYVNLDYYNGSAWVRIATQIENAGSYKWTVPADAGSSLNIRVSTVEGVTFSTSALSALEKRPLSRARDPQVRSIGGTLAFSRLEGIDKISVLDPAGRLERSVSVRNSEVLEGVGGAGGNGFSKKLPRGMYRVLFTGPGFSASKSLAVLE